jgi:hypothetical protein
MMGIMAHRRRVAQILVSAGPQGRLRLSGAALLLLVLAAAALHPLKAQTADGTGFNPLSASIPGVHLYSVSIYSGDYLGGSGGVAGATTGGASPFATGLVYGGSASLGWTHSSDKSNFSASYTPSFFGAASNSNYNTLNHQMSLHESIKAGKWTVTISSAAALSNLQQLLFSPTVASSAVSVPSTFDDLAAAVLAGTFTNNQLAAILTGSPVPASPEQSFIYGERIFTASLTTGVSWAPSTRTSFHLSASGMRAQNAKSSDLSSGVPGGVTLAPTTTATVGVGWSYSLTPRTTISVDAASSRVFDRMLKGYNSNGSFGLSRTMSRRWFVQLRGGGGILDYSAQAYPTSKGFQYLAGASLGYKTQSHTFTGSYNRTVGDNYGVGANATSASSVAWQWRVPGSPWSVASSFEYQQLLSAAFVNATSWRANASISRSISAHLFLSAQFGFYKLPANLAVAGESLSQNGIVLMMAWSPSVYR